MRDIQIIYSMLSMENPIDVRLKGFELARNVDYLSLLIMPSASGFIWEECAQIVSEKSDVALEPYLDKLLEWLYDLNWAGSLTILDRLQKFSGKKLKQPFINAFNIAQNSNNQEGLKWLDYLSELLDNEQLRAELPERIITELKPHYKNWGFWYND